MGMTAFQDVRFAPRQFAKQPGFILTAVMVLALGLGANTAIFSVVDAFPLRSLPYKDPSRLVALFERDPVGPIGSDPYNLVGLALVLAAVGLYGVLAYAVSGRTGEIGICMALGASAAEVRNMVVRQGIKPALAGIALGILGAFLASQVLKSMLFGISATDPVTFILVPALLLVVAVFACYAPARRASRIDPVVALRAE